MLSSTLNRASRSVRARRVVERVPASRRVVDRFVAGQHVPDAVDAAVSLRSLGRRVSLDVLGEHVRDLADARSTCDSYITLLWSLNDAGAATGTDVSLKLTALGQSLWDRGDEVALTHAQEIATVASSVGATVTLDMEDHTTTDSTLTIGTELRREFPSTGNVLQSNLRRTPGDIAALARSRTRIRLVKGAYKEPASVAYQRKAEVDDAYSGDLEALMASNCYPMVATHDPRMLAHAAATADRRGRGSLDWETQMLYGIRVDLQAATVAAGRQMRVYVPFGTDWYGSLMRRLAERPANVAFFLRALVNH